MELCGVHERKMTTACAVMQSPNTLFTIQGPSLHSLPRLHVCRSYALHVFVQCLFTKHSSTHSVAITPHTHMTHTHTPIPYTPYTHTHTPNAPAAEENAPAPDALLLPGGWGLLLPPPVALVRRLLLLLCRACCWGGVSIFDNSGRDRDIWVCMSSRGNSCKGCR